MTANAVPINAGRVRRIRKDLALRRVEVLLEVSRRCALATRLDDILAVLIEMTSREIDAIAAPCSSTMPKPASFILALPRAT